MADFCLECWNKINGTDDSKMKYVFSKKLELCEGCGEWKRVIIEERWFYYQYKLRFFLLPFKIIGWIIFFLWRLLLLPYLIFRFYHRDNH